MSDSAFARIPAVSRLLDHPELKDLRAIASHSTLTDVIRGVLSQERDRVSNQHRLRSEVELIEAVRSHFEKQNHPGYRRVINATGIVLHTNLGRSPLAEPAAQAAYQAARGYLALEINLETGERASRQKPIREKLVRLTGAESATVVNNCAAATILALKAVAAGREVLVSRGQLIEIGGSFRLPEIMSVSGAILREVGTTNITRLADYETAMGDKTGAVMRVHCSNYRVRGFTQSVGLDELVSLGRRHNLPVIDDVGSGAMLPFIDEPNVRDSIANGADLVLFSGDKLLGGPQAGIIVGTKGWIETLERDPLMRAFRLDKMTLAALETTLDLYSDHPEQMIPTLKMLTSPREVLRDRCERFTELLRRIDGITIEIRDDVTYAGGGTLPDQPLATVVIAIRGEGLNEDQLAYRLRTGSTAVMARIKAGDVLIDLRTVFVEQERDLLDAIAQAANPA